VDIKAGESVVGNVVIVKVCVSVGVIARFPVGKLVGK
jgi:hypothetical protein